MGDLSDDRFVGLFFKGKLLAAGDVDKARRVRGCAHRMEEFDRGERISGFQRGVIHVPADHAAVVDDGM